MLQYTTTIEADNQRQLERFAHIPPHASYIAGFIDGDGCLFIRKIANGYQSGFVISQSRTNVLQIIRYYFGGSITSSARRNDKTNNNSFHKGTIRNQYNLYIRSNEYQLFMEYLQHSFIIKENQYQCICAFHKIANTTKENAKEKEDLYSACSKYNKTKQCIHNVSRLNIEYIAGLFDAEGCFYINQRKRGGFCFCISITQKNNPWILEEIAAFLHFGIFSNKDFKLYIYKQSDCLRFVQLVKHHLIVKYNQAESFETFLQSSNTAVKEQMCAICKREKHEIEQFAQMNQNDAGKERYFETMRWRNAKATVCKEIRLKEVYRKKSEKMKKEGNHNFGKTFSQETKQKMSISIRNSKGGVSDEVIQQARQLIQLGKKNIEIQQLLHLPRHTMTRIKNGWIVCRNEEKNGEKEKKKPLTQIEINLSKRKIVAEEIIVVVEKLVDHWKPAQILNYLIESRTNNNLTIHIVKNIKRSLLATPLKHVIYKTELSKERYDYYLILCSKLKTV